MTSSRWRWAALRELTWLRFREFTREPEAVFWGLVFPVLLASGLGIAFRNQPAEAVRIAVVSPELAEQLANDPQLNVERLEPAAARAALRDGRVALVIESGPGAGVIYRYDDTNPEQRTARMLADRAVQRAGGRVDPVATGDDVVREVGSRYIDFLVPGLVGMGIMGNGIWGIGFSIVDARRRKLMKRLVATPMPRQYYLASYLLWRMLLLVVEVGVPVAFGVLAFGVPLRGSLLQLAGLAMLGSLAFSALGLLIASRVRTIEAVSGLANAVMLPMWILSGVFFSAQRFPDFAQPIIRVLPLTALVDALRANMLQGTSMGHLPLQVIALTVWLVVCFGLAFRLFRWR